MNPAVLPITEPVPPLMPIIRSTFVEAAAVRNRLLFHWINLHSPTYVLRHLIMLGVLFVTRLWVLDFHFYRSLLQAVRQLPQVRTLRKLERKSAGRTDAELSRLTEALLPIALPFKSTIISGRCCKNTPSIRTLRCEKNLRRAHYLQ